MNQYFNPYGWQQPSQRIQNLSSILSTEAQIFYVNNPQDMDRINPTQNVLYIGINSTNKEVYIKQVNSMGLIDLDVYIRKSAEQQKNELTKIVEKLDQLIKEKENVVQSTNGSVRNEYADKRNVKKSSAPSAVQSDNIRTDDL